jgi:hypothetical protein
MDARYADPWAITEPGFEPYTGPSDDDFAPIDSQTLDLRAFLRSQLARPSPKQAVESVVLPDGSRGELTQRATDSWEILVHIKRDLYRVFNAPTRAKVLEAANVVHRARLG